MHIMCLGLYIHVYNVFRCIHTYIMYIMYLGLYIHVYNVFTFIHTHIMEEMIEPITLNGYKHI